MTGGHDSRVTLAAILNLNLKDSARSFTYFRPENPTKDSINDLFTASKIMSECCVQHKVIHLKPTDYGSDFHKMYANTFKHGARHPALARAYFEELPLDILSLVSTCSETGTAFYKERDEKCITPEVLAKKFSPSSINKNPDLIEAFEEYINHVQLFSERILGFDFYDLFYWEHRNDKWASLWYSEADLAHFTVVPFNQRSIIESMLAFPLKDRIDKTVLKNYINKTVGIYW
jgi:asparagine synthase (glutamine-hydrolysing)